MPVLTKKTIPVTTRGTTDASTYERHRLGNRVWYDAPRTSKPRRGEPDHYTLPVDEDLCIVHDCDCWIHVNVLKALRQLCKHMIALEKRLVDEKQQRMASFVPTHRLQLSTGRKRNYWHVQVINVQMGTDNRPYFDVIVSPKNRHGRHYIHMVPETRLKPLPKKEK